MSNIQHIITDRYDPCKINNKSIIFIYKNNFRPIFIFNTNIEHLNLGYNPKMQVFIFMLKNYKVNIKRLITSSISTEDTYGHIILIYLISKTDKEKIWRHFKNI